MADFAAGATGERRMQRALTGKYDLAEMNKFIKLSEVVNASLASVCGCSEDDLEVDVDLYGIYKKPADERRALIEEELASVPGAPASTTEIVNNILSHYQVLDEQKASNSTGKEVVKSERRVQRSLTGTYNLTGMKAFQELENEVTSVLARIYGCEADDLDVDVDTIGIYNNNDPEDRQALLEEELAVVPGAPDSTAEILSLILARYAAFDEAKGKN